MNCYTYFDCVRQRTNRAGRNSGGVGVFVNDDLMNVFSVHRLYENYKNCVILHFSMSRFEGLKDIILYFTYISPEGSSIYVNQADSNGIVLLQKHLDQITADYPLCSLFLAGDFNSRTKDFLDYIINDDLYHVFGDTDYDGDTFWLPRLNKEYNQYGRFLADLYCLNNIHFLNGRLFDDKDGNFTCIANQGASVVDYNIASTELFQYISHFRIENRSESDHFPIYCQFTFNCNITQTQLTENLIETKSEIRYKWRENYHDVFAQNFREMLAQSCLPQYTRPGDIKNK